MIPYRISLIPCICIIAAAACTGIDTIPEESCTPTRAAAADTASPRTGNNLLRIL